VYILKFEWDAGKAARNVAKHGITFGEAASAFADEAALVGADLAHSASEPRSLLIGTGDRSRILTVAFTVRRHANGEAVRIISARRASRKERARYRAAD
jgi:uncharacterized DUF497 family protein